MNGRCFPRFESGGSPAFEAAELAIGHGPDHPVADGISIALPAGGTIALVGGNGSGKTTFLRTLAGLLPPLSGRLAVFGGPPESAGPHLAWLGQFHPENPLLPLRVRDVVRMACYPRAGFFGRIGPEDEAAVDEALDFAGVAGLAKKTVGNLSGGQRQRVFLAYAVARRAPLVLLDEPQQNLDEAGDALVAEAMRRWREAGTSIVVATHDAHEAGACDAVLNFKGGGGHAI